MKGSSQPGGIINLDHAPEVGEIFKVGSDELEILEALELIPPRGDFHYIHVTCKPKDQEK